VALLGAFALLVACGGKDAPAIAELTSAEGPVDKQVGTGPWAAAKVGTTFRLGDAARTADGAAGLLVAGGAQIAMQPHTILRFGGDAAASKIAVELGAIELSGTGSYGLDVGDVRLSKGKLRITAKGGGESSVELLIGEAQVSTLSGTSIELEIGRAIELSMDVEVRSIDAGVPDAAVAAASDAAVADPTDGATIEITGLDAEVQAPGASTWTRLPAGPGVLAKGSKVRVGKRSSAKITAAGTTLALGRGARMQLGEDLVMVLEAGNATATTGVDGRGQVRLPGGAVALAGTAQTGAGAELDVSPRESRVSVVRGTVTLTGANGGELAMSRGESARLAKAGTIRVIDAIPTYFDFRVAAGETLTIHDPKGVTAVQFAFGGKCADGGFIELDRDARYRTARISSGKDSANMRIERGSWAYRLRCSTRGGDTAAVASGRIVVVRDAGRRPLPKQEAENTIDADGRTYRISYQSAIPNLAVRIKGGGGPFTLHVARGGSAETYRGPGPTITVPGKKLEEGTYTYWIERNGVKDPKVSTLTIDFDNVAPQVYIEAPVNGRAWGNTLDVRGAVLPGWTAAIEGITIPIDRQRRFRATVDRPPGKALAIKLAHPKRGVHYYLRRE